MRLKIAGVVVVALLARSGIAVELARGGKPVATIVIPAHPSPVESYAAEELQYHVEGCSGAKLEIISEPQQPPGDRIYLGRCEATAAVGVDPSGLPGNAYIVHTVGHDLFIAGKDSERGNPLGLDTHEGTLFAVYDLLETHLHVRWLWPGKLGEFFPPRQANLSLSPADATVMPALWFKQWRLEKDRPDGEQVWLKRQRFGRSVQPSYGHSFGKYWPRFGADHPEYFAMLPDGTRRLDPHADPGPDWVHMCVSEPGLVTQIVADWKARGTPEFLNVCENDGWAGCACPRCLAWDEPDPDNPAPFDQRLAAARKAFDRGRDDWQLQLGSLSDRYARFWKNVAEEGSQARGDVKVVSYVYDNYRKPPIKPITLGANVLCGVVPQESIFGYSKFDSEVFRHDWEGWAKTGCALFLRPNYTLQAPNFPAFYARTLGNDLKFAAGHGLRGVDFDSLTGKYAVQGPSLYMLAATLNHPDAPIEQALDDFYAAFGQAAPAIKEYFALWESIYPHYSEPEQAEHVKAKRKYGAGHYGPYYLLAADLYPAEVMTRAAAILDRARALAGGDPVTSERVVWLSIGLRHANLILAAQRAFEHAIDTGDRTEFQTARQALADFRAANADYDRTHFAGLTGNETVWDRKLR